MPEQYKSTTEIQRTPVIAPGHTFGTVTEKISAIVLTRPASNGWFIGFGICFMLTMMMLYAIGYLFVKGIGIWGVTIPIGWGFAIVNFVWRGSARHWHRYETMYLLLAGLATPLVLSVHTVVSFDFAIGIVPGWHTTIFPPYFVAGAIYSGFAMVLMLAIPIRKIYGLEDFITERHLQNSAKVMLATGLIVAYGYGIEAFMGWYGGDRYDAFTLWNRLHGPYAVPYWMLLICNIFVPQVLWIRKLRTSPIALFFISGVILVGMWLERFIIVVVSLQRDFLTSSWGMYYPTRWDWMTYIGTIGMFLAAMFLFLRILPAISIFELRTLLPEAEVKEVAE